jgi:hypothetical protein
MVPKGGLEPPRVASHAPQTCASASSATSAKKRGFQKCGYYSRKNFNNRAYLLAAGDAAGAGEACCVGAGVGVDTGAGSSACDSNTDREPVRVGRPRVSAINMNAAAAPIVIFARRLAVPRGPNAVLETLLEKSAPASALPGCRRITTTRMKHDKIKRP